MSNVNPGDRAVVIKARDTRNLGKLVLVIERYKVGSELPFDQARIIFTQPEDAWLCESLGGPFYLGGKHPDTGQDVEGRGPLAPFPDSQLRRLDPPEEEQISDHQGFGATVKDSQTVTEEAMS